MPSRNIGTTVLIPPELYNLGTILGRLYDMTSAEMLRRLALIGAAALLGTREVGDESQLILESLSADIEKQKRYLDRTRLLLKRLDHESLVEAREDEE